MDDLDLIDGSDFGGPHIFDAAAVVARTSQSTLAGRVASPTSSVS